MSSDMIAIKIGLECRIVNVTFVFLPGYLEVTEGKNMKPTVDKDLGMAVKKMNECGFTRWNQLTIKVGRRGI